MLSSPNVTVATGLPLPPCFGFCGSGALSLAWERLPEGAMAKRGGVLAGSSGCGNLSASVLCPPGVIAVVIFTILCTLVFLIRYMFRHKGTYHTNEAKGAESAESADAAIMNNDPNFTETIDESKKEWLI